MTFGFQESQLLARSCLLRRIYSACLSLSLLLLPSAIAPDFSQNLLKAQTLARHGGDVLIECKPRMSPRGIISWRKGKEALRENHRYAEHGVCVCVCVWTFQSRISSTNDVSLLAIHGLKEAGP